MRAAVKQSPAPVPSTTVVGGGVARATTAPPRRSSAPSPPEGDGHRARRVEALQLRVLGPVDDDQVGAGQDLRRHRPSGRGVEHEHPGGPGRGRRDGEVGHLQHGEHGVGVPQLARRDHVVGARDDDDRGLAAVVDRDQGVPGGQLGVRGDAARGPPRRRAGGRGPRPRRDRCRPRRSAPPPRRAAGRPAPGWPPCRRARAAARGRRASRRARGAAARARPDRG